MHESKPLASLAAALLVGVATLGSVRSASASSSFPAALQKSLSKQFPGVAFCVPLCTACHLTTVGGPKNLNVFGENLEHQPRFPNLILGNTGDVDKKVDDALTRYWASTPAAGLKTAIANFPAPDMPRQSYDSDGDGISDYEELRNLDSPSIPLPRGEKEFCPDIAYGCGARIAAAPPPVDHLGLFSTGLVVLGLAAFRRLKRARGAG
ncbi:MAG: hypothetical protein WDO74_11965 [Pseudomonadota bacterium]